MVRATAFGANGVLLDCHNSNGSADHVLAKAVHRIGATGVIPDPIDSFCADRATIPAECSCICAVDGGNISRLHFLDISPSLPDQKNPT
jgi:hypothetical protein